MNFIRAAVSATRKIAENHCVTVLLSGFPSEVKHAEEVCTSDSVTAFTAIMRISFIKIACSPACNEPNITRVAKGAKINSPTAAGAATAKVINNDL